MRSGSRSSAPRSAPGGAVSLRPAFVAIAGAYAVGIMLAAVGRTNAAVPELDPRRPA